MDGELGGLGIDLNRTFNGVERLGKSVSEVKSAGCSCLCCLLTFLEMVFGLSTMMGGLGSGFALVCRGFFLGASF